MNVSGVIGGRGRAASASAVKAQLRALTGIRGLAAWLVVLYHARLMLTGFVPGWGIAILAKGYLAVDLFFMLSGFVIGYNYRSRFMQAGLAESGIFLWRRLARIWPLHAVILAAMLAFVAVLAVTGRDHSAYPMAELPLHILLLQNWGFTSELSWNHPAWSISTEMAAYLLFPFLTLAAAWDRRSTLALVLSVAALLAVLHAVFSFTGREGLGDAISQLGLVRCLAEFAAGTALSALWLRWKEKASVAWAALAASVLMLAGGVLAGLPETAFVPAVLAAGLLALAFDRGPVARMLGSGLPHWLGEVSYATYLSHFFLLILFKIVFVDESLRLGPVLLVAYMALVLFASAALYYGVERPAQRWLNARTPQFLRGFAPAIR
ncbi:MAG: acyltransferase [Novosphingobium sp.]|nr:acyltransferase [Novosphingobium sp.]